LSTSGISSILLSQTASSTTAVSQFAADLNQPATDLQSGNMSAAGQDYITLTNDAENSATAATPRVAPDTSTSEITTSALSQIASSPSIADVFAKQLNHLGTDLQNGDLTSAQQDMLNIDSTALNATSSATTKSSTISVPTGLTPPASQAQIAKLNQAIVQAMQAGDYAAVGSAMSELAFVSPSPQDANALQQEAGHFTASSTSVSASSSSSGQVNQLLQSLDSDSSDTTQSILSQLA